jgi:anti-sigma regulatory factor (Ser/Thr protein kinase)
LSDPLFVDVGDVSQVSAARIATQKLAQALEFDPTRAGRVALVVTEALTNVMRHGGGGAFAARALTQGGVAGIEMLAIDSGRGMADFAHSARDGVTSGTSPGTGLGAIGRLTDEFDVLTAPELGTILRMVVWAQPPSGPRAYDVGAILVPKTGETACGDAWAMVEHRDGATFMVVDGLGHGPDASRAAHMALDVLRTNAEAGALRLLDLAHARLRPTRGAALAVLRHERSRGEIAFVGVGNISASVIDASARRAMVSHNGIVGHNMHKSEEYRYPWPRGALLVVHSDGLETQWDLAAFPGAAARHPSLAAAALFRRHSRKRDDVAVLVARELA